MSEGNNIMATSLPTLQFEPFIMEERWRKIKLRY